MGLSKESIEQALTRVLHPSLGADVVTVGAVQKISACDGYVSVRLAGANLHEDQRRGLMQQVSAAVRLYAQQSHEELHDVHVEVTDDAPASPERGARASAERRPIGTPQSRVEGIPNVRYTVAVGAGKGGVGKSTVAVNIAVGLARRGYRVGLMDGDIYGPSLPTMMGLSDDQAVVRGNRLEPFYRHGVRCMTLGKLVDPEKPLIWRGPMAHGAFKQLAEQTEWGELDYLIIDLPPGTGDVSLTMAQVLRLAGAVVVCTPQKVAQDDAVRAARMFQQLGIEVLGVVENMSYFIGDDGKEYDIFGRGGAQMMAQRLGLPYLGALPINMRLRENSDIGDPSSNFDGSGANGSLARDLEALVTTFESQVALAGLRTGQQRPELTIS